MKTGRLRSAVDVRKERRAQRAPYHVGRCLVRRLPASASSQRR